jgi:hypothetical protein
MKNYAGIVLLSVLLPFGCTSYDETLAEKGDWYKMGYRDGVSGSHQRSYQTLSSLSAFQQSNYDEGYTDGLNAFCNPNIAYQVGLSGQYYDGICDGTSNGNRFRMEWQRGWDQYNQ